MAGKTNSQTENIVKVGQRTGHLFGYVYRMVEIGEGPHKSLVQRRVYIGGLNANKVFKPNDTFRLMPADERRALIFPEGWDISAVRALDEEEPTGQNRPSGVAADGSSSMPPPPPDNGNKPVTGEDEGAPVTSIAADILCRMGLTDFRMICPEKDIFIEQWVRFRCMFGCGNYGKSGSCPPAVPSVAECREAIMGYRTAILIHQTIPFESRESYEEMSNQLHAKLLEAERQLFLAGYYKALLLSHTDCHICASCRANGNRENCVCKTKSRPSVEAMGIDVYKTARSAGYEIDVVRDIGSDTNRFAIILLD